MAEIQSPPNVPPAKFSRYRSVRQASAKSPNITSAQKIEAQVEAHNILPARSMSRYRKSRGPPVTARPGHDVPATPMLPKDWGFITPQPSENDEQSQRTVSPASQVRKAPALRPDVEKQRQEERMRALEALEAQSLPRRAPESLQNQRSNLQKQQEVEARKQQEELRQREQLERAQLEREEERQKQHRLAEKVRMEREEDERRWAEEDEVARLLAEQKRKDLERLEAQLEAAALKSPATPGKSPTRDRFAPFLKRITTPKQPSPGPSGAQQSLNTRGRTSPPKKLETPQHVLNVDAPQDAVNAGERLVLVRYKQSSINLPVTPETTPIDLAYSASNILSQEIIPSSTVVMESYVKLGLERRIRRYEHVRDIMNSWDRDTQNALVLQPSDSKDLDLVASSVPKMPLAITAYMYYSQKPGKWTKMYVTLLNSGQVFTSPKSGARSNDKSVSNICHLSDFDIYAVTPQQLRKTIRPPKKYCYAIKSQHKTTIFLNTENYVHFFCSDDKAAADEFYKSIQEWRSWYLVTKKSQGQKKATPILPDINTRPTTGQLYAKPLMDATKINQTTSDEDDEDRPRQIPFHLRNSILLKAPPPRPGREPHPPPGSLPPSLQGRDASPLPSDSETFAPSGLLGRTYTQRQKAQRVRETPKEEAFIAGPSLLNSAAPETSRPPISGTSNSTSRTKSIRRPGTATSSDIKSSRLQRGPSKRIVPPTPGIPTPLLDFEVKFVEAPQWRAPKGHGVEVPKGVHLVDVANTPDLGVDAPAPVVFRRNG